MLKNNGSKFVTGLTLSVIIHSFLWWAGTEEKQKQGRSAKKVLVKISPRSKKDQTSPNKSHAPITAAQNTLPNQLHQQQKNDAQTPQKVSWQDYLEIEISYPAISIDNNEQGVVEIMAQYAPDGSFQSFQMINSSGYPRLDLVIQNSLRNSAIKPELLQSVPLNLHLTFNFEL